MRLSIFLSAFLLAKAINPAIAFNGGEAHISGLLLISIASILLMLDMKETK